MLIAALSALAFIGIGIFYLEAQVNQSIIIGQRQHEEKIALLNQMIEKKSQQNAHAVVDLDIFFTAMVWTLGLGILFLILILFLRKKKISATPTLKSDDLDILTEENSTLKSDDFDIQTKKNPDPTTEETKPKKKKKN